MVPDWPRGRLIRRLLSASSAILASATVLGLCAAGAAAVPGLGPALLPGHGAWTSAAGGLLPGSQTLALPGLSRPATIWLQPDGMATISAASVPDAYLALGYLHARFRLEQMDLQRRVAEGRLAELSGPNAVPSDRMELRLGLLRTAQREWAQLPRSGAAARALTAYARGVNDDLAQARSSHQWPALFSLAGVYPQPWTPEDSLAVQGLVTQELTFSTAPLDNALLERSLGPGALAAWFGVLPADPQSPYDVGPHRSATAAPGQRPQVVPGRHGPVARTATTRAAPRPAPPVPAPSAGLARAAAVLLTQTRGLRRGQLHGYPGSAAFAANGPVVAGGRAMLAAAPHLALTVPSAWYEVAVSAPGLAVSGVSVPGLPAVVIGRNAHIAWTLTDTQNQSTLYYVEQVRPDRPGRYFWAGRWRQMRHVTYTIRVRNAPSQQLTVYLTVHGPVLTRRDRTISVAWTGSVPSPDLAALLQVGTASDFAQFRAALAGWRAPAQTFLYADDRGNIGAIAPGYYPVVRAGSPWLPLPGTGDYDVAGAIPDQNVPQVYDPASHVIVTSGQRPVAASYPYYIGTSGSFDPGYRAGRQYALLRAAAGAGPAGFAALQADVVDQLAVRVLPRIVRYLRSGRLSPLQLQAERLLASWNDAMTPASAGAAIWWTLWEQYLSAVFGPLWATDRVPVRLDPSGLGVSAGQASLDQVLERWTLSDPANAAFTSPAGPPRTAGGALRAAFAAAVAQLRSRLGGSPASWAWGRLHQAGIGSLTLTPGLGLAPRPAAGSPRTVDAAAGLHGAPAGPSWRMIVDWTGRGRGTAEGVYPGGQSGNPVSPWYLNLAGAWRQDRYLPLPPAARPPGRVVTWGLQP